MAARITELGIYPPPGLDAAIDEGEAWLLRELVSLSPDQQRRGPLEVCQEAMRFSTEAAAGLPPVARDPVSALALPGDRYDLDPASS